MMTGSQIGKRPTRNCFHYILGEGGTGARMVDASAPGTIVTHIIQPVFVCQICLKLRRRFPDIVQEPRRGSPIA